MNEPLSEPEPGDDAPARRGRLEIRTILILVVAVVLIGAVVSLVFGPQGDGQGSVDDPAPGFATQSS